MPPPQITTAVADCVWEIPPSWRPGMRVPIRIYASVELLGAMDDAVFQQAANVARLPGIGFDINCGMRLAMTTLTREEVTPRLRALVDRLAERVPAGVGCHGSVSVS